MLNNSSCFPIEFGSVKVRNNGLLGHYLLIRLSDDCDDEVQQNHEDEPLVHKPNDPDEHNHCHVKGGRSCRVKSRRPEIVFWVGDVTNGVLESVKEISRNVPEVWISASFIVTTQNFKQSSEQVSPC